MAVIDSWRHQPGERFEAGLARLDRLPFGPALGIGIGGGAVLVGLAWVGGILGIAGAGLAGLVVGLVAWRGQAVPAWEPAVKDLLEMVEIRGGTFLMGSPEDEGGRSRDELQHEVTVSDFLIGRTVVTRKEYRELLELDEAPGPGGDEHPVTEVSWLDAATFCNRLSEKAGFEPCYEIAGEAVRWVRDDGGYRLPTEAEWEYAARAGTTTRWSFGEREARLGKFAWFLSNSGRKSRPVATRKPNPWGLNDVHGNVWEWCWDVYGLYKREPQTDPRRDETAVEEASRVVRGGSFGDDPWFLRSGFRGRRWPEDRSRFLGFRCVRRPGHQP
ncbi:MAG: formylglycine-generating enzyme family protein [Thermoanaerobaculia bacterium]|nr:formylglycine-generating enzyme family protein [Thermoanaerobaculia bacterium]